MATGPKGAVKHVVILVQENHTTDNYFRSLGAYGANVATDWPLAPGPSWRNEEHHRHAYFNWWTGQVQTGHVQFDTAAVLPFYAYLAVTGAFFENHCSGFGTNSTPNHLLLVGGQSPTLTNPHRGSQPEWDMPSLPGLAEDHGVPWRAYTGKDGYPLEFYTQLKGSANVERSATQFATDAKAGTLPPLCLMWHDTPLDEHPPVDIRQGMNAIWQVVDAVVQAGSWDETVFLLTWDDWGGFDDHVATPCVEYTPDNVQLAYGPRVPLLMFGGRVSAGIDRRWCSHVSVPKTAMQLLGLPKMGVPRLDNDPGLADRVGATVAMAAPPGFGARISLPPPPKPRPPIPPLPGPPGPPKQVGEVVLRGGATLPPPDDVVLPRQSGPPPSFTPRPGTKPKPPGKPKPKGRGQTSHGVPHRQPRGGGEKRPRGPTKQRSRKRKR